MRETLQRWRRRAKRLNAQNVSPPARIWRDTQPREQFDVLFVGDTAFGENYQEDREKRGRTNILKEHGYAYSFARVAPLLNSADLAIANLETPLTAMTSSPLEGKRPWVHRSDPLEAPKHLLALNIKAVTLANNHSADYGTQGLFDTLETLAQNGILAAGAGRNLKEAQQPLEIAAVVTSDGTDATPFKMRVFSVYRGGRQFTEDIHEHADDSRPGSAPLKAGNLARRIRRAKERDPAELVVVCPHWRRDYQWRSKRQAEICAQLMDAGADLILGHGSHTIQEIEQFSGRWVVHGLGNFVFNSGGRYKSTGAPPYGLVARLSARRDQLWLRLYPIAINNRRTKYQPRLVSERRFNEVVDLLTERTNAREAFERDFRRTQDEFGWHLATPLRGSSETPRSLSTSTARRQSP